jgi:hypothetical protein
VEAMTDEVTFYRDMWLAQRAENEQYRSRLGEMSVSDEASEEIVALRAEVGHWKAIAQAHNDSLVERIAENERLREALEEIGNMVEEYYRPATVAAQVARAALIRVEESALSAESATYNEKSKP